MCLLQVKLESFHQSSHTKVSNYEHTDGNKHLNACALSV